MLLWQNIGKDVQTKRQNRRYVNYSWYQCFPSQIEAVLLSLNMDPNYQIVVDRANNTDSLEVQVEMTADMFQDTLKSLTEIERKIASALQSILNISAKVRLLEPKSIPRSEGKAKRVIDKRHLT